MRMKKTILIIAICVFSGAVNAQKNLNYIFFYDPNTSLSETNLFDMPRGVFFDIPAQYKSLKSANIGADVTRALAHKDFRFVAINGNLKYECPGVAPKEQALIKRY